METKLTKGAILFALLSAGVVAHRVDMKEVMEVLSSEDEAEFEQVRTGLEDCTTVSRAVVAQAADGDGWQGIYKCFKVVADSHAPEVTAIMCDNDPQSNMEPKCWTHVPDPTDDCPHVSLSVRSMAYAGAQDWQGVYKCTRGGGVVVIKCDNDPDSDMKPRCWVIQKPDDIQKAVNAIFKVVDSAIDFVAKLVMPAGPSDDELQSAVFRFFESAGADMPTDEDLADLFQSWQHMTGLEKEVTVLALNSAKKYKSALLQTSDDVNVAETTEGFWQTLFRLIAALFRADYRNRRTAAARTYMKDNIGWDDVRSKMRRAGWRW